MSTIAAVEAGRRPPSWAVLTAVLEPAGLELAYDVPPPDPDGATVEHLRLSPARRLHLALGGDGRPDARPAPAAWSQLGALAARSFVHLHGATALRVWLPGPPAERIEVCARLAAGLRLPETPLLTVQLDCPGHTGAPVSVRLGPWSARVESPADLALVQAHAEHRTQLRAVARLLHREAARDTVGRRTRAHADPAHTSEHFQVFHTKRFAQLPMPSETDVRSWRLEDDASLVAWLRRQGYPV